MRQARIPRVHIIIGRTQSFLKARPRRSVRCTIRTINIKNQAAKGCIFCTTTFSADEVGRAIKGAIKNIKGCRGSPANLFRSLRISINNPFGGIPQVTADVETEGN